MTEGAAALRFDCVGKRFGGVRAVHDVSFEIRLGTMIGVIGPNGAGKTTLVNMAAGQTIPDSGRIFFGTVDGTRLPSHRRFAMGLGRTFQGLRLYPELTCLENLIAGDLTPRGRVEALLPRAQKLLDLFELHDHAGALPGNMPFGKQKLLAIGRALLGEPRIVLLDEPFAGLTEDEIGGLGRLLTDLVSESGAAILVVEHNLEALSRLVELMVVLDQGELIAAGPPQQVLEMERVHQAYFGGHRKAEVEKAIRPTAGGSRTLAANLPTQQRKTEEAP